MWQRYQTPSPRRAAATRLSNEMNVGRVWRCSRRFSVHLCDCLVSQKRSSLLLLCFSLLSLLSQLYTMLEARVKQASVLKKLLDGEPLARLT